MKLLAIGSTARARIALKYSNSTSSHLIPPANIPEIVQIIDKFPILEMPEFIQRTAHKDSTGNELRKEWEKRKVKE